MFSRLITTFPKQVAAWAATALLALPLVSQAEAQDLTKVTLVHAVPQLSASFANESSVPHHLGFWKDEGLEVEVLTVPGTAAAMQLVIGGQADVGVGNAHAAMVARQKGAAVTSYYTSLRGDIFGIAFPEDGDVKTIADLRGKTVGVSSFASGGTPYARALLGAHGLDSESDVTLAEVGVGGRAGAALQADQVQALSLWDEMYVRMRQSGIKLGERITDERAAGLFASNLVVPEGDIEARRDILVRLARGIAKAQLFTELNPEAAVRIHWHVYPQSVPREGVTDETVMNEVEVIRVREAMQSKDALGTGRYGDIPMEVVASVQDYFVATDQLEQTLEPQVYYTNDLIDEINDFDEAAVRALAQDFKLP